jgi:hypothetical protein
VVVRPTPYGVGLVRQLSKPTGREAAGAPGGTRRLVVVRPTPYGFGFVPTAVSVGIAGGGVQRGAGAGNGVGP